MILAGTGSRPNKLGGYNLPNPIYIYVCQQIEKHLTDLKPDRILSGMALGYDSWLANIAIKLGIPLTAAVPFLGQELAWPQQSQKTYHALLNKASEVVVVSEGGYSAHKMQIRNEWLVNNCDLLLGCWNGTSGGTANCLSYAKSINRETIIIDPRKANT